MYGELDIFGELDDQFTHDGSIEFDFDPYCEESAPIDDEEIPY